MTIAPLPNSNSFPDIASLIAPGTGGIDLSRNGNVVYGIIVEIHERGGRDHEACPASDGDTLEGDGVPRVREGVDRVTHLEAFGVTSRHRKRRCSA